jgi:predicted transcriptional regulator
MFYQNLIKKGSEMLKHQFKIALAAANMSQTAWAKKHQIAKCTLTLILNGKRKSRRITTLINSFIEAEFSRLKIKRGSCCKAA